MAQPHVLSPVHLHDSSLVSALGGALSPSPWSRFLSPSLFSQRSTPVPQVAPGPSPLKESTVVPPQPDGGCGLFTHAREINPFEKSFAVVDPEAVAGAVGRAAARMQGRPAGGDMALQLPLGRSKRKRALSSPAVFTPGGSRAGGLAGEAFMKQAKRPDLRLVAKDSGIGMLDESSPAAAAPSTYSLRSSSNSFDSTGSSLLRHRRGQSLTNSPETSAAPSPLSDKLGAGAAAFDPVNSTFNHFQTQPVPFTMPAGQPPAAYPDPSLFAPTSLAPSSLGPDVVAPLPFDAQGPPFDSTQVQVNPAEAFGAYEQSNMQFLQPGLDVSYPPLAANFANPLAVSANPPHPHHLTSAPPAPIQHGQYLPLAHPPLAHQPIPLGAPIMPSAAPPPPFAAPVAKQTGRKKVSAASSSANGTHSAASGSPAAPGDSASPAPAPTKPPGKKRGRKPKNWDPTLERTVELDPEERERQRKLALERNRIAASKSRRRKKERVELLETASSDLCSRNLALQAECRALFTEVHSLRTFLSQNHPEGICTCTHINGYLARERDGGGIPAILYGAGSTLDRDYTRTPKWGDDDDLFAGAMESAALEAFSTGGGLAGVPGVGGSIATGRKKAVGKAGSSASPPASNGQVVHDTAAALDTLAPVVGPAQGSIPLKAPTTAGAGLPKKQAPVATRRTSSRRAAAVHVPEDEDDSEGDDESEEEEAIELKSRRARAIAVRTKSG